MKKEIKIIIAGVIIFLFLVAIALICSIFKNGGFTCSLLWDAFICTMIAIGISIICGVIAYLLVIWIEK